MNTGISPFVVAARILSVIGMGLTAAVAILLALVPEWLWAGAAALAFLPFLGLIVLVERYSVRHGLIGVNPPARRD
ncbi:MAG: hypothetical protein HUU14_00965 [Dehalococcoidia bacterium]|nr:MAG: hypothetical protein EDM76_11830 [bacterium]MCE7927977.1 hypothetical protein [Chloroflexi bacterium CFX7]MCL4229994.1 hypothetical protein [Dehalococcoidia bacterium]NUQ54440.1 hypothetical protein [Dehalococcoidia bacterium]RIL02269.1 MAG: hypothetical protein DCC78_07940 [bacterium]